MLLISLVAGLLLLDDITSVADMKDWVAVPAKVNAGGVDVDDTGDSESRRAFAEYEYEYEGKTYHGDRVNIYVGSTSVGDYQREMGQRFAQAELEGTPIEIFVDPANPEESIVDREMSWGRLIFKAFLFILLGIAGVQTLAGKSRFAEQG